MKKLSFIFVILFMHISITEAKHLYPEKFYQKNWCKEQGGILEYKLIDDTRVDCLTTNYAVEFDFAPKWAEAIGQSLHYATMTGKKAGINLIIEKDSDFKYYHKIEPLCKMYDITLWYSKAPEGAYQENYDNSVDYIFGIVIKFIKYIISLFIN